MSRGSRSGTGLDGLRGCMRCHWSHAAWRVGVNGSNAGREASSRFSSGAGDDGAPEPIDSDGSAPRWCARRPATEESLNKFKVLSLYGDCGGDLTMSSPAASSSGDKAISDVVRKSGVLTLCRNPLNRLFDSGSGGSGLSRCSSKEGDAGAGSEDFLAGTYLSGASTAIGTGRYRSFDAFRDRLVCERYRKKVAVAVLREEADSEARL